MNYMDIPGTTPEYECKVIQGLIKSLPENSHIVEIGTGAGRITAAIAEVMPKKSKLMTIDNYSETIKYKLPGWNWVDAEQSVKKFIGNSVENILFFLSSSETALVKVSNTLDMVYLDGGHDYDTICKDIKSCLRKLKIDGILAGHDWDPHNPDGRNVIWAISDTLFKEDINRMFHVEHRVWWTRR